MFTELSINNDYLIVFFYVGIALFVMHRAYGVANILRFVFRYFNFKYTDRRMQSLDEKWFNVQLFKVTNGINVSNIDDARIIQKGINEGRLNPAVFSFSSSWGDVTIGKSLGRIIWLYFVGLIFFCMGSFAWYQQESLVGGYAKFDYMHFSYYLSKNKLIITSKNSRIRDAIVHSKQDCKRSAGTIDKTSMFSIACQKLLDESETFQWWLSDEIRSVNKSKDILSAVSYFYCAISFFWWFSLTQYLRANRQVRKYKYESDVKDA